MLEKFITHLQNEGLVERGNTTLVAASAGVDSTVLSYLFHQSELPFAIAHCNFQLRGDASDTDAVFVKKLAESFDVPFFSIQFETQNFATQNKMGIQEAARKLRYDWLSEVAEREGYSQIATAHHLDDNIETVLFNFSRGTGVRGMKGILPKRGNIIRPMLFATKEEVLEFAKQEAIAYREDESNQTDKYARNKIRHHVIPTLSEVAPNFHQRANRSIEHMRELSVLLNFFIDNIRKEILEKDEETISINLKKMGEYPASSTLFFELVRPYGFNSTQANDMLQSIDNQSGAKFLSPDYEAVISSFYLKIRKQGIFKLVNITIGKTTPFINTLSEEFKFEILEKAPAEYKADTQVAHLAVDKIQWPLQLRRWKEGDVFCPLGMGGHRKKLQDFFTDQKLSLFEKDKVWLLESGNEICWVVGMRLDERFKVRDSTKPCLKVEIINHSK